MFIISIQWIKIDTKYTNKKFEQVQDRIQMSAFVSMINLWIL